MNKPATTFIWDLPLRIFHWSLVLLVTYAWISVEILENLDHHFYSGYGILALLIFRVAWGFLGPKHARFSSFVKGPKTIRAYLRGGSTDIGGHNPLGALSVIMMLLVLLAQAVSGLFSDDEYYYFGPLTSYVSGDVVGIMSNFHHLNVNIIMAVLGLHLVAIIFYELVKKQRLIKAMFTGSKPDELRKYEGIEQSKGLLAIAIMAAAAATVFAIAQFGN